MSTDTNDGAGTGEGEGAPLQSQVAALSDRVAQLEESVPAERGAPEDGQEAHDEQQAEDGPQKMSIVATKGTLDMAYPPLILASTAAAFGYEVTVFHTFWGLDIVHEQRSKQLKLSAVGNPTLRVPNVVGAIPGMDRVTTRMMQRRIEANDTATIEELVHTGLDMGVDFQACQMTIELMGYDDGDFYDGVTVGVGAGTAMQDMAESDIQLLV